jgi:hypothetical protein
MKGTGSSQKELAAVKRNRQQSKGTGNSQKELAAVKRNWQQSNERN